ncbi:energy transducer TonB [Aureitalea sp. L0-47]|nr:energy transducer TonB [Aureitalea sp. L0-47]
MQKIKALGLSPGRYRTSMIFKITKEGKVTDIKANNYREVPEIEEEAVRVASLLPEFKPGDQRGEIVSVMYGLPIVFDIEPERKRQRKKG